MTSDLTPQTSVPAAAKPSHEIDPHFFLRPQLRVIGEQSKTLGKVVTLECDADTSLLTALVVRHGLFRPKLTRVPAKAIKWVNQDSVVLSLSPGAFQQLPLVVAN